MNIEKELKEIAEILNCDIDNIPEKVRKLKKEVEELENQ